MSPSVASGPLLPVVQIKQELDALAATGFLVSWQREGRRWLIEWGGAVSSYSQREVAAWLDGAHAMGGW